MKIITLLLAGVLVGCTSYTGALKENAAEAADQAHKTGKYAACEGSTAGAIFRNYKGSEFQKWAEFCGFSSSLD